VPVRQVLPDLAILGISQRAPSTLKELTQARGVDDRHTRGSIADEILVAVRDGRAAPAPTPPPSADDLERNLRPAVALISAWIGQLARDESIDTALLATRSDLVAFLRGDAGARLANGWRAELLGDGIRSLIAGESGLTFDGQGRLRLIPVAR
jgi:ribonuclease D